MPIFEIVYVNQSSQCILAIKQYRSIRFTHEIVRADLFSHGAS